MGAVMGDMERAIQEALFCHEMFEPYQRGNTRYALEHIMRVEATWAFSREQIQVALAKLLGEGLVQFENERWCSSQDGRIARERTWKKKGCRHPTLSSANANAKDVILALIRSGGADYEGQAHSNLEEQQLDIFLPDVPNETKQAILQELVTDGLIQRGSTPLAREVPLSVLTAAGLRFYAQQIVPRLGLKPPSTILAAVESESLPFADLGLPQTLADNLRYRWEEAERCIDARSWLSANILFGSILEVVLPEWLSRFSKQAMAASTVPCDKHKKPRPLDDWTLAEYITVATELKLIDPTLTQHATALRQTRNLVHPKKQILERSQPDGSITSISKHVVLAILEAMARSTTK